MILIVGAMKSELREIMTQMTDLEKLNQNQIDLYMGYFRGTNMLVLLSGIGKVNASMALSIVLSKYKVKVVVNMGIVGATKPFHSGEVVVVEQASYHDFDLSVFGYQIGQVPGYPAIFKPEEKLFKKTVKTLNKRTANLYTGDSFMLDTNLVGIFDMEGAALYQVASQFEVSLISIKIVSDVIGEKSQYEQYQLFEAACSVQICDILNQIMMEVII